MNSTGYTEGAEMVPWNISGNMGHPSGNELNDNSSELRACVNLTHQSSGRAACPYNTTQLILIVMVTSSLSLVTVLGNMLVMLSIKVNRQLQTVNNYFLFSLACADLITGLLSMNLYTLYIIRGRWPLGAMVCDLWLVLDYVVGNASVMNLLIISFDRYFCVTRPLSYPARRTAKLAGLMIASAWLFPLFLWTPAILCWQTFTGKRIVPDGDCYIQLLSSPVVTLGTTLLSFYLPAVIMIGLYTRISLASHSRLGELQLEQGTIRTSSGSIKHFLLKRRSWVASELETRTSSDTLNESVEAEIGIDPKPRINSKLAKTLRDSSERADSVPITSTIPSPAHGHVETPDHVSRWSNPHTAIQYSGEENYGTLTKNQNGCLTNIQQHKPALISLNNTFPSIRKCQERTRHRILARERKVTRTISAILLAFVLTWTPYNVMAIVGTFCRFCIPDTVWILGYWLCYVNSTINPGCYAMCNVTFRKTFWSLLRCRCGNMSRKWR